MPGKVSKLPVTAVVDEVYKDKHQKATSLD
jgi:hypothetical protein